MRWLSGELTQRQIGVGWALLRDAAAAGGRGGADGRRGRGGVRRDRRAARAAARSPRGATRCSALLARADADEQAFLVRLLLGDLRQGALAGVMADAVAKAAGVPATAVRRALMLRGDLAAVAAIALRDGRAGLAAVRLAGRPAARADARGHRGRRRRRAGEDRRPPRSTASSTARACRCTATATTSRSTRARSTTSPRGCPRSSPSPARCPARALVLDGEAIALRDDGRPEPFQVTAVALRHARRAQPSRSRRCSSTSCTLDGEDLLDAPLRRRAAVLERVVPPEHRVPRTVAEDADGRAGGVRRRARRRPRGRRGQGARRALRRRAGAARRG